MKIESKGITDRKEIDYEQLREYRRQLQYKGV